MSERRATAVLDADNGLGQPAAVMATRMAIAKAQQCGMATVTVRRSNHFGIAGYYARMGARAGMMTLVTTNATPQVAPTHGTEPMYGTNPIAVGLPTDIEEPFVFDAATSVVPRGKLERLAGRGRDTVPVGWAIDGDGRDATDLADILLGLRERNQHALLPLGGSNELLGGHKGYGLGLIVDLLCGPLAGAGWGRQLYRTAGAQLGHFVLCLSVDDLLPLAEFRDAAGRMFGELRRSRAAAGSPPVRIPGDDERATRRVRLTEGIPLGSDMVTLLLKVADELGAEPPMIDGAID